MIIGRNRCCQLEVKAGEGGLGQLQGVVWVQSIAVSGPGGSTAPSPTLLQPVLGQQQHSQFGGAAGPGGAAALHCCSSFSLVMWLNLACLCLLLVGAVTAQTFSHFPVTNGRSDAWTAPVGRPPGREKAAETEGAAEALLSLLDSDKVEEKVRGRTLARKQGKGDEERNVVEAKEEGRRLQGVGVTREEGRRRVVGKERDNKDRRTEFEERGNEQRTGVADDRVQTRGRSRLVNPRVSARGRKVGNVRQTTAQPSTTTSRPRLVSGDTKRGRGSFSRGGGQPRGQSLVTETRTKEPRLSIPSKDIRKEERSKLKKEEFSRRITIKKPNKERIQSNVKDQSKTLEESAVAFLPTVPPKKRKQGRKGGPLATGHARRKPNASVGAKEQSPRVTVANNDPVPAKNASPFARRPVNVGRQPDLSIRTESQGTSRQGSKGALPGSRRLVTSRQGSLGRRPVQSPTSDSKHLDASRVQPAGRQVAGAPSPTTQSRRPQDVRASAVLATRKPAVNNIGRSTTLPQRLMTPSSTSVPTTTVRRTTSTRQTTTTQRSTTSQQTTKKSRTTSRARRPSQRRPAVTLNEAFAGRSTGKTTAAAVTQPSENNQRVSPKFAVAVAGRQSVPAIPPPDEAPSVLSPLGNVLSIVNMRNDPSEDHEAVKVVPYSIEKALSHAELTWAADPFRNSVSKTGKPTFNIDFTKNPASSQPANPPKQLHKVPEGRAPVSLAHTRHLGRVETVPSSSNRLRQSFADEEAQKLSQSFTDEDDRRGSTSELLPQPRKINNNASRRPRPDKADDPSLKPKSAPLIKEPVRKITSSLGRRTQEQSEIATITKQRNEIQDSIPSVGPPSQVLSKTKTTSLEDLTWTPALLQRGFDREQLSLSAREPKNPDDIFVFFRS